jgi:AcrR family transcriptional regulator
MPKTSSGAPPAKRTYNSSRRALQAAQTRQDVLEAAVELFRANGWSGTTLAAIAEAAGVAVETVYNGFSSKKALLRAAMDAAIVGDVEPIPFVERPEFRALAEGTFEERIARAAEVTAAIHERSAGIWQAITEAAGSDEEVDAWRVEMEEGRRLDVGRSAERIVGAPVDDHLVTTLWILYSPETYQKLVVDSGMTRADYETFLATASDRLMHGLGAS